MMIVKANKDREAGIMPDEELIAAMKRYNEELSKAGVLLDLAGLQPSSKGARVKFTSGEQRTVVGGPFTDTAGRKKKRSNGPAAPQLHTAKEPTRKSNFASSSSWRISPRVR
jgi:hypothetical protein